MRRAALASTLALLLVATGIGGAAASGGPSDALRGGTHRRALSRARHLAPPPPSPDYATSPKSPPDDEHEYPYYPYGSSPSGDYPTFSSPDDSQPLGGWLATVPRPRLGSPTVVTPSRSPQRFEHRLRQLGSETSRVPRDTRNKLSVGVRAARHASCSPDLKRGRRLAARGAPCAHRRRQPLTLWRPSTPIGLQASVSGGASATAGASRPLPTPTT